MGDGRETFGVSEDISSPLLFAFSFGEQLMDEEIVPKLDVLRAEKRSFLAYQKATSELERLVRLVKAAEWMEATKREQKAGSELTAKKGTL